MSRIIKAAIAIDLETKNEIFRKYSKIPGMLLKLEENGCFRSVSTADMEYCIYLWDQKDPGMEMYGGFKKILMNRRHSILEITEDGSIIRNVKTHDIYGCDEEFEEILGWTVDITLWNNPDDSVFNFNEDAGWICDECGYCHCPVCGFEHDEPEYKTPYCPSCGIKLIENN